jgi:transcriptional regulator of arginine metabolism
VKCKTGKNMSKKLEEIQKRHSIIKNLILSQEISNQTQLQKVLKQQKIKVTQATLSRDLTELGIARIPTSHGHIYKLDNNGMEQTFNRRIADEIISIKNNECIIVVTTYAGRAQGVAEFIDRLNEPDIIGTLAGDNTIIIVPHSVKRITDTIKKLKTIIGI